MSMLLRRQMMRKAGGGANGWHKLTITADQDYLKGNTTTAFISSFLPVSYRYAVALSNNLSGFETSGYIAQVYLPSRTNGVHGVAKAASGYSNMADSSNSSSGLIIRQGQKINLFWRTEEISEDIPDTNWGYRCITPGTISNAQGVKEALVNSGPFELMVAVSDLDFSVIPTTNNTYADSITNNSLDMGGRFVRASRTTYTGGNTWTTSSALIVSAETKIACFYLT